MRIAALLRLLLLDKNEPPVLKQVQTKKAFTPKFVVADDRVPAAVAHWPSGTSEFIQAAVDPDEWFAKDRPRKELGDEEFYSLVVCRVNGMTMSVRELVEHVGYVSGVVHAGKPRPKKRAADEAFFSLRSAMRDGGNMEIALILLRQIGRVAHRAMLPLLHSINESANRGFPLPRFDYEGASCKSVVADGVWRLQDMGYDILVSEGAYDPIDSTDPSRALPTGRRYIQYVIAGQIWRAYGAAPPAVGPASVQQLVEILTRHAQRVSSA
jgi:hypothetical protein